jgi:hypothetical protein
MESPPIAWPAAVSRTPASAFDCRSSLLPPLLIICFAPALRNCGSSVVPPHWSSACTGRLRAGGDCWRRPSFGGGGGRVKGCTQTERQADGQSRQIVQWGGSAGAAGAAEVEGQQLQGSKHPKESELFEQSGELQSIHLGSVRPVKSNEDIHPSWVNPCHPSSYPACESGRVGVNRGKTGEQARLNVVTERAQGRKKVSFSRSK